MKLKIITEIPRASCTDVMHSSLMSAGAGPSNCMEPYNKSWCGSLHEKKSIFCEASAAKKRSRSIQHWANSRATHQEIMSKRDYTYAVHLKYGLAIDTRLDTLTSINHPEAFMACTSTEKEVQISYSKRLCYHKWNSYEEDIVFLCSTAVVIAEPSIENEAHLKRYSWPIRRTGHSSMPSNKVGCLWCNRITLIGYWCSVWTVLLFCLYWHIQV